MMTSLSDPSTTPSASEDAGEDTPLVSVSSSQPTGATLRRRHYSEPFHIRKALFTSVACGIGFILIFLGFESEWFERYEELGFSPRVISAQSVADNAQAHFLPLEFMRQGHREPPEGCEATVMLVRHCEKSDRKANCDYVGFERSVYLATLFGNHEERWPSPSYIYALHPGHRNNPRKVNFREIQTVKPVAEKFGLDINTNYTVNDKGSLARAILYEMNSGNMCGKVTLIAWKHSDLPPLARRLGCGPLQGCPYDYKGKEFDPVWQIKFVYGHFERKERKHKGRKHEPGSWMVYGDVQQEGFDPLAFSKKMGDYPKGGTLKGARWIAGLAKGTDDALPY